MAIGVIWAILGIFGAILGVGVVMIGLNGFMSIGPVTTALWFVVSPILTVCGGIPVAIAYFRGASIPVILFCAMASIFVSMTSWISVFVAAPA